MYPYFCLSLSSMINFLYTISTINPVLTILSTLSKLRPEAHYGRTSAPLTLAINHELKQRQSDT